MDDEGSILKNSSTSTKTESTAASAGSNTSSGSNSNSWEAGLRLSSKKDRLEGRRSSFGSFEDANRFFQGVTRARGAFALAVTS